MAAVNAPDEQWRQAIPIATDSLRQNCWHPNSSLIITALTNYCTFGTDAERQTSRNVEERCRRVPIGAQKLETF